MLRATVWEPKRKGGKDNVKKIHLPLSTNMVSAPNGDQNNQNVLVHELACIHEICVYFSYLSLLIMYMN